jgi:hypothetical protein
MSLSALDQSPGAPSEEIMEFLPYGFFEFWAHWVVFQILISLWESYKVITVKSMISCGLGYGGEKYAMKCCEVSLGLLFRWKQGSENVVPVILVLPCWLWCPITLASWLVTVEFPLAAAGARFAASCFGL